MQRFAMTLFLLTLAASSSAATAARESRPFPLVSLAQLGTVTWRCDNRDGTRQALAFSAFALGATESVRFSTASIRQRPRIMQPGQVIHFPALHSQTQQLVILQRTKVASLRAVVTVHFSPSRDYCFSYWPPTTDVRFVRS
jgi:hypothetical protein